MRIAVINVPATRKGIQDYVKALAKGMEAKGHNVDILDVWTEDGFRLPGYEYVAVCAEAVSGWGGKTPEILSKFLTCGSGLVGKKSAAFIKKTSPFFVTRSLTNLMRVMEKEGMMINWCDIIFNAPHAEALGKRIGA